MKNVLTVAFALGLGLLPRSVHADNLTTLSLMCSPVDAVEMSVSVSAPDVTYKIHIQTKGMDILRNGERTLEVDGDSGQIDGVGTSYVQSSSVVGAVPVATSLTIHFETLNLEEGGVGAGYIETPAGMHIPFSGVISGHPVCG